MLGNDWNATRDTWREIPTDLANYLRQLLDTDGSRGEMVEVVFGQQLHFFYEADSQWCTQQLLPRFDWADPHRARRVWDGYLSGGRWNNRLVADGFVQKMLSTLAHREQLSEVSIRRLLIQLADISIYSDTDPRASVRDLLSRWYCPRPRRMGRSTRIRTEQTGAIVGRTGVATLDRRTVVQTEYAAYQGIWTLPRRRRWPAGPCSSPTPLNRQLIWL